MTEPIIGIVERLEAKMAQCEHSLRYIVKDGIRWTYCVMCGWQRFTKEKTDAV